MQLERARAFVQDEPIEKPKFTIDQNFDSSSTIESHIIKKIKQMLRRTPDKIDLNLIPQNYNTNSEFFLNMLEESGMSKDDIQVI